MMEVLERALPYLFLIENERRVWEQKVFFAGKHEKKMLELLVQAEAHSLAPFEQGGIPNAIHEKAQASMHELFALQPPDRGVFFADVVAFGSGLDRSLGQLTGYFQSLSPEDPQAHLQRLELVQNWARFLQLKAGTFASAARAWGSGEGENIPSQEDLRRRMEALAEVSQSAAAIEEAAERQMRLVAEKLHLNQQAMRQRAGQ